MSVTLPNGLTLPNNDAGITGDFATVEKQVQADQAKLNQDDKNLDVIYDKGQNTDADTASALGQAYDTYKTDAQTFANDHSYLMQIAEQDAQNGKGNGEVQSAIQYGEGARVTENNLAQYANLFEKNRGTQQALGGASSAADKNLHSDVNAIVASANEVGLHDTTKGPNKGDNNTPVAISSPFNS